MVKIVATNKMKEFKDEMSLFLGRTNFFQRKNLIDIGNKLNNYSQYSDKRDTVTREIL